MPRQQLASADCVFCYDNAPCTPIENGYRLFYFPKEAKLHLFSATEGACAFDSAEPFYSISFTARALTEEGQEVLLSLCAPVYCCEGISAAALRALKRFEEIASAPKAQRKAMMKLHLTELLLHLGATEQAEQAQERKLGARVKQYIDTHLTASLSLDELAKQFFVSKFYLCRTFKAQCHQPIGQYIREKRIEVATALMQNGETASAASYQAGFGDYSTFYRAYKKTSGKSPMEIIK